MATRLRIYHSHQAAAEAEALDASVQSPQERIKETVELILRVYNVTREQLLSQKKKYRINIVEYK